jgi:hypothetical protein
MIANEAFFNPVFSRSCAILAFCLFVKSSGQADVALIALKMLGKTYVHIKMIFG